MIEVDNLRGDMIMSACLRSDLAPIPYTFEAQVRVTQQTAADFKDNAVIIVNRTPFRIVKSEPILNAGGGTQGKEPINAVSITALPDGLTDVARPRTTAVIFENASLAGIYRACGASVPITGDLAVGRFSCLCGEIPTFAIARNLQEEGAVAMWRKNTIAAMSIRDLMQQVPVDAIDTANSETVKSDFLTSEQIPAFFSIGPDGKFIYGVRRDSAQALAYVPRKTERALNSMGKVLVRRKTVTGKVNPTIRAGNVVSVGGVPYAVMTVAQYMKNDGGGDGPDQRTVIWLGVSS